MLHKTLNQRYEILQELGGNGGNFTYDALDTQSKETVIVKELNFTHLGDWKNYDLFEREVALLKNLSHTKISQVLETFRIEEKSELRSYLILEKKPGQSLEQKLSEGWVASEEETINIAEQLLDTLTYLHYLNPPVIHRDIKPSNIILDSSGNISLIDFGSIQQVLEPEGGSTIVGTFGYMPPEQFMGQTTPGSDLYALGATLIHIISGIHPSDMVHDNQMRLKFQSFVECSSEFNEFLSGLIQPELEKRANDAKKVLERLLTIKIKQNRETELTEASSRKAFEPVSLSLNKEIGSLTLKFTGTENSAEKFKFGAQFVGIINLVSLFVLSGPYLYASLIILSPLMVGLMDLYYKSRQCAQIRMNPRNNMNQGCTQSIEITSWCSLSHKLLWRHIPKSTDNGRSPFRFQYLLNRAEIN